MVNMPNSEIYTKLSSELFNANVLNCERKANSESRWFYAKR